MSDHRFQNCVTKEAKILLKLIIVCEIVQYHQSYTNFTSHSPSLYKVHAHGYFFSVSKNAEFIEFPGGLVQDLALSLLWLGLLLWLWFNSWPKNCCKPWEQLPPSPLKTYIYSLVITPIAPHSPIQGPINLPSISIFTSFRYFI